MKYPLTIGILALQGGYASHQQLLNQRLAIDTILVRTPADLVASDGLILPGGESTVLIRLLQESQLWQALIDYNKPLFGTCAGAILLAQAVSPAQATLNRIGIALRRNAAGRQLASDIKTGCYRLTQQSMEMVLIRAPKIEAILRSTVKILATLDDQVTAAQEDHTIAATFHPELTQDTTLHTYFVQLAHAAKLQNPSMGS